MSSQPEDQFISIVFSDGDIEGWAEVTGVPFEVARERAHGWAKAVTDSTVQSINEQMLSIVEFDQP